MDSKTPTSKPPCCRCCTSTGKPHNPTNRREKAYCCRVGRGPCDCPRPSAPPAQRAPDARDFRSSHEHKSALGRFKKALGTWEKLDPQDQTWARLAAKGRPACQAAPAPERKPAPVPERKPDPVPAPKALTAWDDSDDEVPALPVVAVQTRAEVKAPTKFKWDPLFPPSVGPHGRPLVIRTLDGGVERLDDKSWAIMGDIEDALNAGEVPFELEDLSHRPDSAPDAVLDDVYETKAEVAPTSVEVAPTSVEVAPTEVEAAPTSVEVEVAPTEGAHEHEHEHELTDDQEREFEAFVAEQEMPPPMVFWYPQVNLPKPTVAIFGDEELFPKLCDFCRTLQNLVFKPEGGLAQTLCLSCRTVVGLHPVNHCQGGHAVCETLRFVGPIGDVAPLCRACHQHEEGLRRTRRNGQRSHNGKSRGGSGYPLSAYVK